MSLSTADSATSAAFESRPSNTEVIDTVRSHHSELGAELRRRTWAVLEAAERGDCTAAREALHGWYRTELMPHIAAEERTLYQAAEGLDTTRLLVRGMLGEHRTLVSLVADLALAREPFETAMIAASAQVLLTSHLGKENDLLLPALDSAGVDLAVLLAGMHEILGAPDDAGCGCDCGHDAADEITDVAGETASQLDVRVLPHGQRHEIIFGRLDALEPGEELIIVNDHDPKPLRYQTSALWPDRFEWSYREAGPRVWRVAITRVG